MTEKWDSNPQSYVYVAILLTITMSPHRNKNLFECCFEVLCKRLVMHYVHLAIKTLGLILIPPIKPFYEHVA